MKKSLSHLLLAVMLLSVLTLAACNGDGGGEVKNEHIHAYTYSLEFGEADGEFNVVGVCGGEDCDAPEVVEKGVDATVASETAPTCTAEGSRVYSYTKDGQALQLVRKLAATSHKLGEVSVDTLLDSDGCIPFGTAGVSVSSGESVECDTSVAGYYTCAACSKVVNIGIAIGHEGVWSDSPDSHADCTSGGEEIINCSRCGKTVTRTSAPLGHLYATELVANSDGTYDIVGVCLRGGCTDPHYYVEGVSDVSVTTNIAPTCYDRGVKVYSFTKDGINMTFASYSAPLSHKIGGKDISEFTNASGNVVYGTVGTYLNEGDSLACGATSDGYYNCDVCARRIDITLEREHIAGEYTVATSPTCTEEGVVSYVCTECGAEKLTTSSPLGHLYSLTFGVGTAAGSFRLDGECTRQGCAAEYHADGITKLATIDTPATCSVAGERIYSYEYNGVRESVLAVIPKLPHILGGVSVDTLRNESGDYDSDIEGIVIDENAGNVSCGGTAIGYFVCDECENRISALVNVKPHHIEPESEWETVAPTCKHDGLLIKECKYCDYTEETVLPAVAENHVFSWTINSFDEKTASAVISGVCTEVGCGYTIEPSHPDAASYDFDVVGASCLSAGTLIHKWTVQGYPVSYEVAVDKFDHQIGGVFLRKVTVDGAVPVGTRGLSGDYSALACGATTSGMYKCTVCANFINAVVINPHNWATVSDEAPTCTTLGVKEEHCTTCDVSPKFTYTSALGHEFVGRYDLARNYIIVSCTRCTYEQNLVDVSPTVVEMIAEPTCSAPGTAKYYYEFLPIGDTVKKPISFIGDYPKLSHKIKDMSGSIVDAESLKNANGYFDYALPSITASTELVNCNTRTSGSYTCEVCGETVTVTVVKEHVYTYWSAIIPPTCTSEGTELSICDVCHASTSNRPIPATGVHSYDLEAYKKDGTGHWHECACGDKIDYAEHSFDGGVTYEPDSCTDQGRVDYTCSVCQYVKSEATAAGSHSYSFATVGTMPTLDADGEAILLCDTCLDDATEVLPKIVLGTNARIIREGDYGFTVEYTYTLECGDTVTVEIEIPFGN